jgi:hypothetical protein
MSPNIETNQPGLSGFNFPRKRKHSVILDGTKMQEFNNEQYQKGVKAAIERFYKERVQEGRTTQ